MVQSKRTEVLGRWPTPAGWKSYILSDVITEDKPETGDAKAQKKLINDAGTVTIIFSGDLQDTKEIRTSNRITQKDADALNPFTGRKLLVAAARETTMGRVGILSRDQTAVINNVVHIITPNEKLILLDFLFYYFLLQQTRTYLQEELAPNSTYIPPEIMATARVVVPPLSEQQRIVERIEALTHDIEKCRTLLRIQREDILTVLEQTLSEAFSLARVKTWSVAIQIRKLLNITASQQKAGEKAYENYPYIQIKNIEQFTGRLLDLKSVRESNLPENRPFSVLENAHGTMLYASNTENSQPGRVSILQLNEAACHTDLFPLVMLQKSSVHVLPDFIYWSLLARTPTAVDTGMRLGDVKVTKTRLFNAVLPFPANAHEQTAIVNHLNAVRDTVRKIREKQDEEQQRLDQMKQHILEKAFRGLL